MKDVLDSLPKYANIAARYRDQIAEGTLRPGDRLPSFAEVRSELGVGQSTLERAHEMLEREALIVREPGRGIFVAVPRRKPRLGVVGLSGIDATKGHHPYFSRLLEGVHRVAQREGEAILLLHENMPFPAERVDGVLLYSPTPDLALRKLPHDLPVVSLLTAARGISSVTVDDSQGIALAMRHLLEQGHRRIAYISARAVNLTVSQRRIAAYSLALREAGIEPDENWVRHLPLLAAPLQTDTYHSFIDWGTQTMNAWLADGWDALGCTALLTHNDDTAVGVARALQSAGKRVPQDVSVVGYDDTLSAELMEPPLTTVHVPLREIGERAMELLMHEINGDAQNGTVAPESVFYPTIRQRASTGAPITF